MCLMLLLPCLECCKGRSPALIEGGVSTQHAARASRWANSRLVGNPLVSLTVVGLGVALIPVAAETIRSKGHLSLRTVFLRQLLLSNEEGALWHEPCVAQGSTHTFLGHKFAPRLSWEPGHYEVGRLRCGRSAAPLTASLRACAQVPRARLFALSARLLAHPRRLALEVLSTCSQTLSLLVVYKDTPAAIARCARPRCLVA
eukprot:scaffold100906_cov28-Tisochrysis_lutea.AAC.1